MERERAAWQMALYLSSIDLNDDSRGQDLHAETQTEVSNKRLAYFAPLVSCITTCYFRLRCVFTYSASNDFLFPRPLSSWNDTLTSYYSFKLVKSCPKTKNSDTEVYVGLIWVL